jgi:hypothetical protein
MLLLVLKGAQGCTVLKGALVLPPISCLLSGVCSGEFF